MPENKYNLDPALILEFVDESLEFLDRAAGSMASVARERTRGEEVDAVFRIVHSIKGNSAFFNLLKVKSLAHTIEDLLNFIREGTASISDGVVDAIISGMQELRSILERVRRGAQEVEDEQLFSQLLKRIQSISEEEIKEEALYRKAVPGRVITAAEEAKAVKKTMRIGEETIDKFLDFVGELVIVGEMYDHIQKRFIQECGTIRSVMDFKKNNEAFNLLSLNLQKSILEIRKIPIESLLQRAPLIVHEIASARNKKVNIVTKGAEIMIDKSLIESLEAPFMHMLRNCVDHGIEHVDRRVRLGKPSQGTITLNVTEDDEKINFVVEDDGAGIDRDAIRSKAVNQGLVSAEELARLSEQDLYQFIFLPGFSTAKEISDVSGRGVGMDVVKKNVEAAGGKIIIESTKDIGTRFTIILPKSITVKIIDGVLVSAKQYRFVLPMSSVGESFEIKPENLTHFPDNSECIIRHDTAYPLVRLAMLLNLRQDGDSSKNEIGIIIFGSKSTVVLAVDEILGLQQVVVKKIEGVDEKSGIIAGGAILGDERIAIVLDTEKL